MEGEEERADSRPAMEKPEGYDDAVDEKRAPVKIILLGDSAVGKTKYDCRRHRSPTVVSQENMQACGEILDGQLPSPTNVYIRTDAFQLRSGDRGSQGASW